MALVTRVLKIFLFISKLIKQIDMLVFINVSFLLVKLVSNNVNVILGVRDIQKVRYNCFLLPPLCS